LSPNTQGRALAVLDAKPRDTWFRVGGALHLLGHDWRNVWDDWSKTAPDYFNAEDQDGTWNGYKDDRDKVATIGWIFYQAEKNGWNRKEADYKTIEDAIDAADPAEKGVVTLCGMIVSAELNAEQITALKNKIVERHITDLHIRDRTSGSLTTIAARSWWASIRH
jgi:Primase C terminal 2 (PriCT-2)